MIPRPAIAITLLLVAHVRYAAFSVFRPGARGWLLAAVLRTLTSTRGTLQFQMTVPRSLRATGSISWGRSSR